MTAGKALEQATVFDAHAHLPAGEEALRKMLRVMDDHGIARSVVVAGGAVSPEMLSRQIIEGGSVDVDADNDSVLRACRTTDGRLIPFYFANPYRGSGPYRRHARSFYGLKLAPAIHGVRLGDKRNIELVEVAEQVEHPVYLHCLDRAGFRVSDLVDLAKRFPSVHFILGHGGIGDMDLYGVGLVEPYQNIVLETSGGYAIVARTALERLGSHRVLFGSEYPLQHPAVELEKFRALNIPRATWEEVAWNNIRRLLGETKL